MTQKQRETRHQRNRELAARDAANRCGYCKIALTGQIVERVVTPGKFCSLVCMWAHAERDAHRQGESE